MTTAYFDANAFVKRLVEEDGTDLAETLWDASTEVISRRTGIWHETFLVRAGEFEAIHTNMPDFGLVKASKVVSVAASVAARDRLKSRPT